MSTEIDVKALIAGQILVATGLTSAAAQAGQVQVAMAFQASITAMTAQLVELELAQALPPDQAEAVTGLALQVGLLERRTEELDLWAKALEKRDLPRRLNTLEVRPAAIGSANLLALATRVEKLEKAGRRG